MLQARDEHATDLEGQQAPRGEEPVLPTLLTGRGRSRHPSGRMTGAADKGQERAPEAQNIGVPSDNPVEDTFVELNASPQLQPYLLRSWSSPPRITGRTLSTADHFSMPEEVMHQLRHGSRSLSVYDQEENSSEAANGAGLQTQESEADPQESAKPLAAFPQGQSTVLEPYRTNLICKLLTSLGLLLSPLYLSYLWIHRSTAAPAFGIVFFLGECMNFILGTVNRLLLWHRQRRRICPLGALSPSFPRSEWPKVHIYFTHYMEPVAESVKPLTAAVQQDYPPELYVVTILDDGYHRRSGEDYEVTASGRAMEAMMQDTLSKLAPPGCSVSKRVRDLAAGSTETYRTEVAPGGSTVVEFEAEGLPLVRLVGRKKGPNSYMKTGNLENALWNVMEADVDFMVLLDTDMVPQEEMLQLLLSPMLEHSDGRWLPNWHTGFVSSPQAFTNIERVWGTDDPMNQSNKFFWHIMASALDSWGLVHFWGTNVAFFVPALRDVNGFVYGCMTEDTVTGAQVHKFGWASAFVGSKTATLAHGLCRETVCETFDQRKRWVQGNAQQFLMEADPPLLLHPNFRFPPQRTEYRQRLKDLSASDRSGSPPERLAEGDRGAGLRRSRRTWSWYFLRELAYFPTKHAILFHVQPIYYYAVTLAIVLSGCPPFVTYVPKHWTVAGLATSFYVVLAYWCVNALANFCSNSYIFADANNPSNTLWRTQQEFWGYAWVRVIGILEGFWSAFTGRQPKWNAFGMLGGVNWLYELPNALAFVVLVLAALLVAAQRAGVVAWGWLPDPAEQNPQQFLGSLIAAGSVLFLLWPVTSCIFADIFGMPYYRLSGVVSTLFAAVVQVGIGVFLFGASRA